MVGGVGPRFGNREEGDRIHTGIQLAKRAPATRTVSMGLWTLLPRRHAHTRGAACKNYPRHVQFIRGMRTFSMRVRGRGVVPRRRDLCVSERAS